MKWFALAPFAPVCEVTERVDVPIGELCFHCGERFNINDNGFAVPCIAHDEISEIYYHQECHIRLIVGSVAHQQKRCTCYGGKDEDDPALTRREAAQQAMLMHIRAHSGSVH